MHFVLQTPSLQHIALVKIVAVCVHQHDIVTRIARAFKSLPGYVFLTDEEGEWKEIEEKVKSKVWALPLPQLCKQQLSNFIKPILMEIIAWGRYHREMKVNNNSCGYTVNISLPSQWCWTMRGTIDYAKTTESMVKDEGLSVERRFEVACQNCLEDEARQLIGLIPSHRMHEYMSEAVRYPRMDHRILIAYFIGTLNGDADLLERLFRPSDLGGSINQLLFKLVLAQGPRATGEYFHGKVNQREKERVFEDFWALAYSGALSPICGVMYYMSLLNEERQSRLFREDLYYLLRFLLDWPMQPLFMEAAKRGWQFISGDDCADVLNEVIEKIRYGFEDYDYPQLFWELWSLSPAEHRQCFLKYIDQLEDLFATKREEFIKLVLNEAPSHHLKELTENRYDEISKVLMDDSVISDVALMECKQTAVLNSSKYRDDVEKRLRSRYVCCLVDIAMEGRIKSGKK